MVMKTFKTILGCLLFANTLNAQQNVGIATINPQATLHVEGDLRVTNTPILSNPTALGIDTKGRVYTTQKTAKAMIVQSSNNQLYAMSDPIVSSFNNATPIIVEWSDSDIISNNIMTFNSADNSFTFDKIGTYEVSGYINYRAGAKVATTLAQVSSIAVNLIALNVTIQLYESTTNSWRNIAGVRYLTSGPGIDKYPATIMIPSVAYNFKAGDKIRVVFYRPLANFASPHATSSELGIEKPEGLLFTKSLKVINSSN